jgi:TP901 family phage tail tape measure protein
VANAVSILISADARRAIAQLDGTSRAVRGLEAQSGRSGGRIGRALSTGIRYGSYAAAAGVAALGYGMVKAVGQAADFQQQLNILQAVSHGTGEQMRYASEYALKLGADTKLPATSAQDAAEAMTELSKAGLNVTEVMHATRGSLQLAAAGNLSAADAANINATSLNQFGLAGSQAVHVADLLSNAANASAGEVTDYAEALKYAGTASHAAGFSIDETVAALAEMAQQGIVGSMAGTSLANAMRALQAPTAAAQDTMDKYGVSIYDAAGKTKPMNEIADNLTKTLGPLTEKTQNQALATIFGTRSVQAARAVFLQGGKTLDYYRGKVSEAGGAQRLAEARTKGFRGALQALQSNLETLGIRIGLKLIPVLTIAATKLNEFLDLLGKVMDAPSVSVALKIVWQGAGHLYDDLRSAIFGESSHIDTQSLAPQAAHGIQIPVVQQDTGVGKQLIASISGAIAGADWKDIGGKVAEGIAGGLHFTQQAVNGLIASLLEGINANRGQIVEAGADLAVGVLAKLTDPGFIKDHFAEFIAIGLAVIPEIGGIGRIGELIATRIGLPMLRVLGNVAARLPGRLGTAVVRGLGLIARVLAGDGQRVWQRFTSWIFGQFQRMLGRLPGRFANVIDVIVTTGIRLFGRLIGVIVGLWNRVMGSINGVGRTVDNAGNKVSGLAGTVRRVAGRFLAWSGLIGGVTSAVQTLISWVKDLIQWISNIHWPSPPSFLGSGSLLGKLGVGHEGGVGGASGALVTRPTFALIGEAGPEAVVPLTPGMHHVPAGFRELNSMPGAMPLSPSGVRISGGARGRAGSNITFIIQESNDPRTTVAHIDRHLREVGLV